VEPGFGIARVSASYLIGYAVLHGPADGCGARVTSGCRRRLDGEAPEQIARSRWYGVSMIALHASLVLAALVGEVPKGAPQDVGVLAIAPPPGPGPALVELTIQLRQRVAEYRGGVLDAQQLRGRMMGQEPGASLAELDRAYEGARASYANGDYDESARTLRAIVDDLEKLPDGEDTFAQWTRAMLRLARTEQSLGREGEARACIERLVRADPRLEVDRTLYPRRMAKEVESARSALNALPTQSLAVAASTPGARVFLDGRWVGAAPLTLVVTRGPHRLSASSGTLQAARIVVDLGEEPQEVFLDFTVPETLRPSQGPGLAVEGDRTSRIIAAGAYLRLDHVLAVWMAEEADAMHVVGSLYDVRRGTMEREGRVRISNGSVPVGGNSALAEFLVTGRVDAGLVELPGEERASAQAALAVKASGEPPLVSLRAPVAANARSRALGWAALGSGVVAVGLATQGALQLLAARDAYDEARTLRSSGALTTQGAVDRYNGYVANGDRHSREATMAWASAGAAALATGFLGWINYRRTGAFGPFRF
jgi:tetratricopeptide (TPR) repeat protein